MKMLLDKKCPTNISGAYHETPLHFASKNGYPEIVKLLLASGASTTVTNDVSIVLNQLNVIVTEDVYLSLVTCPFLRFYSIKLSYFCSFTQFFPLQRAN